MSKSDPIPTPSPTSPMDTITIIRDHLADLHHTQKVLAEQSVGAANQIFILEHILKDMEAPIETKKETPEGSPPANPNVPETEAGVGTNPGHIL